MRIKLSEVESFIRQKPRLRHELRQDMRRLKIIREADLAACTYYHLRKFLGRDKSWKIFMQRYTPKTGFYVDIVLFKGLIPMIVIELKWNRSKLTDKDRDSLNAALKKLKVNKVYYLTTTKDSKKYGRMKKQDDEKYQFKELVVGWDLPAKKYREIKLLSQRYKKEMATGRNMRA